MQDQYAGDIGDYIKFALLRALAPDRHLSIAWFKTTAAGPAGDGKHIAYLNDPRRWRDLDASLFDALGTMVRSGRRSIEALQDFLAGPPILLREQKGPEIPGPSVAFHDQPLDQATARTVWFVGLERFAFRSDLLFLDPDNGLTDSADPSRKHVAVQEARFLRTLARTIVVYHHLSRRAGGHEEELRHWAGRLVDPYEHRAVCTIRARAWSARAFFIVGPDRALWDRAEAFARHCPGVEFCALSDAPDAVGLTPGADAIMRQDAFEEANAYRQGGPFRL